MGGGGGGRGRGAEHGVTIYCYFQGLYNSLIWSHCIINVDIKEVIFCYGGLHACVILFLSHELGFHISLLSFSMSSYIFEVISIGLYLIYMGCHVKWEDAGGG